ncbi:glycoside hydrolase family 16 protein [Cadophora sp. DSE1049]|nr:glycoside hydrolase family 16 protein [Cadophora sp. DSE1049]
MPTNITRSDLSEYRFDWTPAHTNFFVNRISLDSKTTDVPSINGSIYLNMWGGSIFAGSPPSSPSIMSVSTIQLYFNTSDNSLADTWISICNSKRNKKTGRTFATSTSTCLFRKSERGNGTRRRNSEKGAEVA